MPPSNVTRAEFDALAARVAALENWQSTCGPRLASLESRVAALEATGLSHGDAIAILNAAVAGHEVRIDALENEIPPDPPDPPDPPVERTLLGGWRLTQEFARGTIAIDFAAGKLWLAGHAQTNDVIEYDLPAMGTGSDPMAWPALTPTQIIPGWWPAEQGYCNGLCWWQGKLWCSPRVFYDTSPPPDMTIYARDGWTLAIPLPRQKFSGFVKRGPGQEPYLGCGGYESGQGTSSGPTLATLQGQVLIQYGWPPDPGPALEHWNERCPREPNYYPVGHVDGWSAWEPRTIDGQLQGRWASDRVQGGGLCLPEGVCYWPWQGTGEINYANQTYTFAPDAMNRTRKYTYDKSTYQLIGWEGSDRHEWVCGQELDAQGRVYLCRSNVWHGNSPYQVDPAVFVYG